MKSKARSRAEVRRVGAYGRITNVRVVQGVDTTLITTIPVFCPVST
jgi:hypothetical protein